MNQPDSSSSTSADVSPVGAGRGVSRNYVLLFALLVLVAAILYFYSSSFTSPLRNIYADKQVGELFDFGRYPHGANGDIEPITWRVLQRNADYLLVIAEQGLDCKPYNKEYYDITWETCTLRHWLNSEFYDKAFNEQERKCILKTSIVNNSGPKTKDYIFLLSLDEAKSLFANDNARRAKPTEYAIKNNAYISENGCCYWWLRSRGFLDNDAVSANTDGDITGYGSHVFNYDIAVRPALKLAL